MVQQQDWMDERGVQQEEASTAMTLGVQQAALETSVAAGVQQAAWCDVSGVTSLNTGMF